MIIAVVSPRIIWSFIYLLAFSAIYGYIKNSQRDQGYVSQKPRKPFRARKLPWQNFEPYDYRAIYLHILNIKRSSLHTRSSRLKHFSVFRQDGLKMPALRAREGFRRFRETGPSSQRLRSTIENAKVPSATTL